MTAADPPLTSPSQTFRRDQSAAPHCLASTEHLFNLSGPLGTFSVQADVCYLARLIGPQTHNDLKVIRDVRNAFAHRSTADLSGKTYQALTFESQQIRDRCKNLILISDKSLSPLIGSAKAPEILAKLSTRNRFVYTVMTLISAFTGMTDSAISAWENYPNVRVLVECQVKNIETLLP